MFSKTNKTIFNCAFCLLLLTICNAKKEQQQQQQQQKQQQQHQQRNQQEIWEQDLTDTFKIEGSDQGLQKVNLKCGSESMHVMLETEKPFQGVMYTRGSFYKQKAPCFVKPSTNSAKQLEMVFSLDQCQTQKEGELYSNIVVIQNDPELITPGDSAFSLECDFRQPRSVDVESSFQARDRKVVASKISLTSPDPSWGSQTTTTTLHSYARSESDTVTYIPKSKTHKPKQQQPQQHTETQPNTQFHNEDFSDSARDDDKIIHLGTVEDVTHTYTRKLEL